MQKSNFSNKIVFYILLVVLGSVAIFPYIWLVSSSLKPEPMIFTIPPRIIPKTVTLKNYVDAITKSLILRWLLNSTIVTVVVIVLGSIIASLAGYAYAKIRFPGASILFLLPLCAMMIPKEVIVVPLFNMWSKLHLVDTWIPLITPNILGVGGMYGVFLFRQFYLSIPVELCEAAKIDGCSPYGVYLRIMLPNSQSMLVTFAIYNFMNTWNDFLDPLIFLNTARKYTVALGLNLYNDMTDVLWGQLLSACVLSTMPLIILFFIAQDKFIESVALSGMKS